MRKSTGIRAASSIAACILSAAIAMPIWGDTLILRDGTIREGTLIGANPNNITFRDRRGRNVRYSVRDVQAVQFGDGPYRPNAGWGGPDRPRDDNRNNPGYGQPPDNNRDNRGYDQSRMERVVLPVGTEVSVRTNERIDARDAVEGQSYAAQIEENIRDTDGSIAIPRGSEARLVVRRVENNGDLTLDVESITVEGRRYRVSTEDQELESRRQGVGGNRRTGEYVGGGAVLGAIIGAIAGGGKGAAIGAGAGAGAGALTQIITRGREVHVPAESVIRFRLDRPLRLRLWS
jgi:hypothetical protein